MLQLTVAADAAGTDAAPVNSLDAAYAKLGAAGGTIIIKGTLELNAHFYAPAHTGKITVKGADANAKLKFGVRYGMGGPTEITNIAIEEGANAMLLACYHDMTVSDTVTTVNNTGMFVANAQSGTDAVPASNTITLNGGKYKDVILNMRNGFPNNMTDDNYKNIKVTLNVGGKADIDKIAAWCRSAAAGSFVGEGSSVTINLNGGKIGYWIGMSDVKNAVGTPVGFGDGMTINIGKDFVLADSFTAEQNQDAEHKDASSVFQGISGNTVFVGEYDKMNKTKVVIAAELYDSIKDSTRFREVTIEKAGGTTPPPVQTGDIAWAYAVVASVALIGYAVAVSKKRA